MTGKRHSNSLIATGINKPVARFVPPAPHAPRGSNRLGPRTSPSSPLIMKFCVLTCLLAIASAGSSAVALAGSEDVFIREDFNDLTGWGPVSFPGIKRHTGYSVVKTDGSSFLRAASNASASGLVWMHAFPVREFPRVRWRWRVENVYRKGDAGEKSGDDYAMRIFIIFSHDPPGESFPGDVVRDPGRRSYKGPSPRSGLSYIWANRPHEQSVLPSPYIKDERMIVRRSGPLLAGTWQEESVNVVEDYRKAFGGEPPPTAAIAVMNDSDDTGESSVSFLDYIEVYR